MDNSRLPRRLLVVAAVIRRSGQILIGQRKQNDRHGLKWEFPGGKVEPGETPRMALRRELQEELRVQAKVGDEIGRYECNYPGRSPIILIFFDVPAFEDEPVGKEFEQIRWVKPEELESFDFLDGDRDIVRRLARQREP
jgi:8-oxo-dGTP diphosphatase